MNKQLKKFRSFSKHFIIGWCLLVLLLVSLFNLPQIFQKGPSVLIAQEDSPELTSEETDYAPEVSSPEYSYDPEVSAPDFEYQPEVSYPSPAETPQTPEPTPDEQPSAPSQVTVIDRYSECAGGPGIVQDVEKISDGTYRTSNQHFQSGACGDVPQTPSPAESPSQPVAQVTQPQSQPTQTYVIRSYPECAGAPGRVRDVDAMSDGSYRTYNEHYQAGACGDTVLSQPQAQITQQQVVPVTAEEYQCEGGNKVYYRIYININRAPEMTGRVDYNSPTCASQVFAASQGGSTVLSSTNQPQYPTLSASCFVTPNSVRVGEGVTWQVLTNGGSGSFRYEWSGDSSVNGQSNSSFSVQSYSGIGTRTARVEVKDRVTDRKVSASCSLQVTAAPATPTPISNQTPFPPFAPIIIPVVAQPQVQVIGNPQSVQCPSGTVEKSRSGTNIVCERPAPPVTTINASNPVQCPSGTVEKSRTSSELLCERPIQTITTTQAATTTVSSAQTPTTVITPAAVTPASVQCPSGTVEKSRTTQEVICERQLAAATTSTQQSSATTSPPESKQQVTVLNQEAVSSIKELPKTGLPLAAIGFSALTPIGLRLKRLLGTKEVEESANEIWIKRQIGI